MTMFDEFFIKANPSVLPPIISDQLWLSAKQFDIPAYQTRQGHDTFYCHLSTVLRHELPGLIQALESILGPGGIRIKTTSSYLDPKTLLRPSLVISVPAKPFENLGSQALAEMGRSHMEYAQNKRNLADKMRHTLDFRPFAGDLKATQIKGNILPAIFYEQLWFEESNDKYLKKRNANTNIKDGALYCAFSSIPDKEVWMFISAMNSIAGKLGAAIQTTSSVYDPADGTRHLVITLQKELILGVDGVEVQNFREVVRKLNPSSNLLDYQDRLLKRFKQFRSLRLLAQSNHGHATFPGY